MHYAIPIFTTTFLGTYAFIKFNEKNPPSESLKKQELVAQSSPQKKELTEYDKFLSQQSVNSIIRTFSINPRCYLIYSTLHKTPLAVHEFLELSTISGDAERRNSFFQDQNIVPEKFAVSTKYYSNTSAYKTFRFHKGHMAAAANYSGDQQMKYSTFSYANTIPQNEKNNTGIWNTFERYSRSLLEEGKCDSLELINGPIFYSSQNYKNSDGKVENENVYFNEEKVLLKNGIIIPPKLYKIIKCNKEKKSYVSGFTFQNSQTQDNDKTIKSFEESLQSIENQTGLEFKLQSDGLLTEYDESGTTKTKRDCDIPFYENLINKAETISDMYQRNGSAYRQKISLDMKQFADKVANLYTKQTEEINKSSETECQKLKDLMTMHKNLFYLKSLKPYHSELSQSIESRIIPCYSSPNNESAKNSIKYSVFKNSRYHYPYQDKMRQLFGESEKKVQAEPVVENKQEENKKE